MDVNSIAVSSNVSASLPVPGDVNGDNVVNVADIQALETALANLNGYQGNEDVLDVNTDGVINNQDVQALDQQDCDGRAGDRYDFRRAGAERAAAVGDGRNWFRFHGAARADCTVQLIF